MNENCKTCEYKRLMVTDHPCNKCCFKDPKARSHYEPAINNPFSLGDK